MFGIYCQGQIQGGGGGQMTPDKHQKKWAIKLQFFHFQVNAT